MIPVISTAGDPTGAAATQEQLLEACLRVLGPDHPATLTTLGFVAHWRDEAGDHSGAAAAWKKLLAARVRVPSTLGPRLRTDSGGSGWLPPRGVCRTVGRRTLPSGARYSATIPRL
ncbi:tetratricopeptide repeat protein [Streptomyces sp. R21]|uniref:Tetratricopeptide repeat protein n=1 Tax=Streptomyces sp. R21 TaxID=3238627 RepID=A0AB39NZC9_9ACTN